MSSKRNSGGTAHLIVSLIIPPLVFVMLTLAVSVIAYCTGDPLSLIKPLSIVALIGSGAVGAFINSRLFGMGRADIAALITTLIMLTVGIIIKRGAIGIAPLINYACYMASSALFAYLATRISGGGKRRHRR